RKVETSRHIRRSRSPVDPATLVVPYHILERGERTVVHIGRSPCELAQAGCLERIVHLGHTEHRPAPEVIRQQANVVEAMIRKREAAMAVHAARLSDEQAESCLLLRSESTVVSSDPLVETGRWRD